MAGTADESEEFWSVVGLVEGDDDISSVKLAVSTEFSD